MPSQFLTGVGAAAGIALINSIGNLGTYAGLPVIGWVKENTHSFAAGLYFIAACALASAMLACFGTRTIAVGPIAAVETPAGPAAVGAGSHDNE